MPAAIFELAGIFVPAANFAQSANFVLAGIFEPAANFVPAANFASRNFCASSKFCASRNFWVSSKFCAGSNFCACRNICVLFVLLFYVQGQQLWSRRDGQLTQPHLVWASLKKRLTSTSSSERSGSVVECLTRDRVAAASSLTGVIALCP